MNAHDDVWLGLDIGGTKIACGVVAFPQAEILSQKILSTFPTRSAETILNDCIELAREGLETTRVRGIGIGIAELVDLNGNITSNATLSWKNFDVRGAFERIAPTILDADVRAAAFGEAHYGAGRAYRNFAYITVGTGISACQVQNGTPYTGARGNALVLGTSTLWREGTRGFILERVASGSALVERYNAISETRVDSGEAVMRAMKDGDVCARQVVESAADALGLGIALYVNLLDPEAVIVGGGLGSADGLYWERAVASARALIYADNARDLPILHAALGAHAGVIGAAALARKHFGAMK